MNKQQLIENQGYNAEMKARKNNTFISNPYDDKTLGFYWFDNGKKKARIELLKSSNSKHTNNSKRLFEPTSDYVMGYSSDSDTY